MKKIRVMIVEDDEDYCTLIGDTINQHSNIEAVAFCSRGAEAVDMAIEKQPDLVLMDLNLETTEMDGILVARKIRLKTNARIIILTVLDQPEIVIKACRESFASGYVLKNQFPLLIPTICATASGTTPQSTMICASLLDTLTLAERTVFENLMGENVLLHSKGKTISNQKSSILHKMGLMSKEELVHIFSSYYTDMA